MLWRDCGEIETFAPIKKLKPHELSCGFRLPSMRTRLLDLAFLVLDMLADDRVVFLDNHLFSHGAGVFLRYVEMARIRGRVQTYLNRRRFRHFFSPAAGQPPAREILETCLLLFQRTESTAILAIAGTFAADRRMYMCGWPISRILSKGCPSG